MNLLERSEKWAAEGAWDKIIERLRASPSVPKSPELTLALTKALLQKAQQDPQYYAEAQRLLYNGSCLPYWAKHYYRGLISLRLGRPFGALDALSAFWKPGSSEEAYRDWIDLWNEAVSIISLPKLELTFRERVESVWATFLEREAEFEALVASAPHPNSTKRIDQWLFKLFNSADIGVRVTFMQRNGKPTLLVWCEQLQCHGRNYDDMLYRQESCFASDLLCWQYVLDCAPQSVRDRWHLHAGHFPMPVASVKWGFEGGVQSNEVEFRLLKDDNSGRLVIELFSEMYDYDEEVLYGEGLEGAFKLLLTKVVGELAAYRYLTTVVIRTKPLRHGLPLTGLPRTMAAMGLDFKLEPIDVLPMCTRRYKGCPEKILHTEKQSMTTRIPKLLEEYRKKKNDVYKYLLSAGIVAGFFVCHRTDNTPFVANEVNDLCQKLDAYLAEHAGARALRVIGYAHSETAFYLDFFAWDLPSVLKVARAFFREHTEWRGGFHAYTRAARVIRLSETKPTAEAETVPPLVAA